MRMIIAFVLMGATLAVMGYPLIVEGEIVFKNLAILTIWDAILATIFWKEY